MVVFLRFGGYWGGIAKGPLQKSVIKRHATIDLTANMPFNFLVRRYGKIE